MPVAIPYYSDVFPLICCYCASGTDPATGENVRNMYLSSNDCLKNHHSSRSASCLSQIHIKTDTVQGTL